MALLFLFVCFIDSCFYISVYISINFELTFATFSFHINFILWSMRLFLSIFFLLFAFPFLAYFQIISFHFNSHQQVGFVFFSLSPSLSSVHRILWPNILCTFKCCMFFLVCMKKIEFIQVWFVHTRNWYICI